MSSQTDNNILSNLKYDLPASVVVFLVAVPLCLGIALASGAPLFSGIIAGIVGGIVVSIFSGSQLGVSGPAAGLAVIVFSAIQELGAFETFLMAVVLAGLFQIGLGLVKAGVIGYYFPSSVIKGMLSGIGIIIFLKQIPHAFGYDKDPEGDFSFFQVDGHNTFSELTYMLDYINFGAIIISVLSLAILILWERPFIKNSNWLKFIPGPLLVVILGVILNVLFTDSALFALSGEQMVKIPEIASLSEIKHLVTFPDFSQMVNPEIYLVAVSIAVVASLETLLCSEATDKLDPQKRITPANQELVAQGIGNIVSGLIGGLPITQVIVRSSANIQSGGKTKTSAFLHGILILISVLSLAKVMNLIPLASLAAILLVVGYKLARPVLFKAMYSEGWEQFVPFVVTIVGIVFTDLLTGIFFGMVVAIFFILRNNYRLPYHFNVEEYKPGEPVIIEFSEDVSFLNKASILRTLNELPEDIELILDATKTKSLHPDIVEILDNFILTAPSKDILVKKVGFKNEKHKNPVRELANVMKGN